MLLHVTESLNTDMVKAENPEAVVATEPQGKYVSHLLSVLSKLLPKCNVIRYIHTIRQDVIRLVQYRALQPAAAKWAAVFNATVHRQSSSA